MVSVPDPFLVHLWRAVRRKKGSGSARLGLGQNFIYLNDAPLELSKYQLVEMYTSCTEPDDKTVRHKLLSPLSSLSSP